MLSQYHIFAQHCLYLLKIELLILKTVRNLFNFFISLRNKNICWLSIIGIQKIPISCIHRRKYQKQHGSLCIILLFKHTLFSGMVPICNIFSYLFGSKNETEWNYDKVLAHFWCFSVILGINLCTNCKKLS